MKYSKEHKIGKKMILESDFSVKSVKTFMGREGYGVNANIYYQNRKIGHIIDSGNGGCLDISYYKKVNGKDKWMHKNRDVDKFVTELPNYTWKWDKKDEPTKSKFDEEEMWNILIDEYLFVKDFKKEMKKIQIVHNNKVFTFVKDNKPHFLDKLYHYNGKSGVSFREIIKDKYDGCTILNDVSNNKAMRLFRTHSSN
jgi:hypothetical protein